MDDENPVLTRLRETQRIARAAKSAADCRKATPEEIELAKTLLKPYHCGRPSGRTGLPCTKPRLNGARVCRKHGGTLKNIRLEAEAFALKHANPVLENMLALATNPEGGMAAVKAGQDLLDRANIGAKMHAIVRTSKRGAESESKGVTVNIGFIQPQQLEHAAKQLRAPAIDATPIDDDDERDA